MKTMYRWVACLDRYATESSRFYSIYTQHPVYQKVQGLMTEDSDNRELCQSLLDASDCPYMTFNQTYTAVPGLRGLDEGFYGVLTEEAAWNYADGMNFDPSADNINIVLVKCEVNELHRQTRKADDLDKEYWLAPGIGNAKVEEYFADTCKIVEIIEEYMELD